MLRATVLLFGIMLPGLAAAQGMAGHHPAAAAAAPVLPTQAGQAAFAAIQEVVEILQADPNTDWSKVDIEALRQHLIDMDNVTLRAEVKTDNHDGGATFIVSGATEPVRASIRRMALAHAATMNGVGGWHFTAAATATGATLTAMAPPAELARLKGLGFIGVLTLGMHHQAHHLMIARGGNPHE